MNTRNHSFMSLKSLLLSLSILTIPFLVTACFQTEPSTDGTDLPTPENTALMVRHTVPAQVKVGEVFQATLTVTAKKSTAAISVREQLSGLSLVDKGDFISIEQNVLRGVIFEPKAGDTQVFTYQAKCDKATTYTLIGFAETRGSPLVMETAEVRCVE